MITKTRQQWWIGATVKVGFLTLKVVNAHKNDDRYLPDTYVLESSKGIRYEFTPYNGLSRID